MKKLMTLLALILVGTSLIGCSSFISNINAQLAKPTERLQHPQDCSWIGQPIDEAVRLYGIPKTYTLTSGEKMYSWLKVGGTVIIGLGDGDAIAKTKKCEITLTTDTNSIISSEKYVGHCSKSYRQCLISR